jgi:nicotinamidase-related amidase
MTSTPLPARANDPYIAYRPEFPHINLASKATALLTVDMQYGCVDETFGTISKARRAGRPEDANYYASRLRTVTIPAIRELHSAFRREHLHLVHTHSESLTFSGDDRSQIHKSIGLHYPLGSRSAQIIEELAPVPGEIVLQKTSSSVFNSTNIHYLLHNLGIENLVICGVVTTGCVETAVRDAADLGYRVVLAEDACAAIVEEMHWASIRALRDVYAEISSTADIISRLN